MTGYPFDHVAVAVRSIRDSAALFEPVTGHSCSTIEELPAHGVNVAFLGPLELIEPRSDQSPVARFIKRRGPGLHHIGYRVSDVAAALEDLKSRGFEVIDEKPRPGARGHQVAFLHPVATGGTLIELVQHSSPLTPQRFSPAQ